MLDFRRVTPSHRGPGRGDTGSKQPRDHGAEVGGTPGCPELAEAGGSLPEPPGDRHLGFRLPAHELGGVHFSCLKPWCVGLCTHGRTHGCSGHHPRPPCVLLQGQARPVPTCEFPWASGSPKAPHHSHTAAPPCPLTQNSAKTGGIVFTKSCPPMQKTDPHPSCSWSPGPAPRGTRPPKPGLLSLCPGGPLMCRWPGRHGLRRQRPRLGHPLSQEMHPGTPAAHKGAGIRVSPKPWEGTAASAPEPRVHGAS